MDDSLSLAISVVITLVIVAVGYKVFFAPKKLARGQKPPGAHELEVATKMGTIEEKSEAMRELGALYAKHGDVWTAESYLKLAVRVLEETEGTKSPLLVPALRDYAGVMRKFGREGQARDLENRAREISRQG